jgi:hypothetical protein
MSSFVHDLRHALVVLSRQPWPSALILTMLAVGIAGNFAVFSLVNGLLLRPLPYPHPERLVYLNETAPRWNLEIVGIDYHDFNFWRRENRTFEGMGVLEVDEVNLSFSGEAERVGIVRMTHDLPPLLGARPLLGRGFLAEEDRPGAPRVAVLGKALWQSLLGGDPSVVGATLTLDGEPHAIVGILEMEQLGIREAHLLLPLAADPEPTSTNYQRTREIGIRMALGAERHQVIHLVLRRGLLLAGAGAALGLGTALASGQVLASLLHGVDPRDPATYGAVTVAVLVVAVGASLPPAWRASRLEPMIALRAE